MSSVPDSAARPTRGEDPFRYGWRFVREVGPDGVEHEVQVGLTPDDLLHPEEGDVIVQTHAHHRFVLNLAVSTERLLLGVEGVRYRVDHRIDWGHDTIRPHAPDVVVLDNGEEPNPFSGTLHLEELGSRPLVVFEVTSEGTRANDLGRKVEHYYAVGVPVYVIVDLGPDPENRLDLRLLGYQAGPDRYEPLPLDNQGRLHVEPLGLVLAIEEDWLICYDEQGNVLADRIEIAQRLNELEAQIAEQAERLQTVESELEAQIEQRLEIERARRQEETARREAEAARQTETQRAQQAEAARQAEAERAQRAEAERQAEAERAQQAEAARQQAEAARQQAEAARQAEAQRAQQAEAARLVAERDREAQLQRAGSAEEQLRVLQAEMARLREELARTRGTPDSGGSAV